jgi:hypothetical protein
MIFEPRIFFGSLIFAGILLYARSHEMLFSVGGYIFTVLPLLTVAIFLGHRLLRRGARVFVPILLSALLPVLLSLIDNEVNAGLFIVIGSILYYVAFLSLYRLRGGAEDQTARALLQGTLMASAFLFFTMLFGLYLNFTLSLAALMLLVFWVMSMITFVSLLTVSQTEKNRVFLYSFLLGVLSAELFFIASFLPFGYLTVGSILTSVYFLFREIALDAFRNTLSVRKATLRIITVLFLVLLVLWSSPWKILV